MGGEQTEAVVQGVLLAEREHGGQVIPEWVKDGVLLALEPEMRNGHLTNQFMVADFTSPEGTRILKDLLFQKMKKTEKPARDMAAFFDRFRGTSIIIDLSQEGFGQLKSRGSSVYPVAFETQTDLATATAIFNANYLFNEKGPNEEEERLLLVLDCREESRKSFQAYQAIVPKIGVGSQEAKLSDTEPSQLLRFLNHPEKVTFLRITNKQSLVSPPSAEPESR